jgi:serine/threonine-protein kinase
VEPERWKRVEELFHTALEQEPQTVSTFLQQACGEDTELLREVQSLLKASKQSLGFAYTAIADVARDQIATVPSVGKRVGAYFLQKKLGEGGMGTVHLAIRADGSDLQQVAVKLIQPWVRFSPRLLRRFTTERTILANLKHPNIASFLDAGVSEDDCPFLIMEYVDGKPIDDYCCNTHLLTNDRLRLFLIVCDAVEHAHENGVIHRDIKPANILVTADGVPKLLDFGIAKMLDPLVKDHTVTRLSQRMMTMEYASPEQVSGGKVAAAADVYALGVLLYLLLAGRHPFQLKGKSPLEIGQIICEQPAEAPSQKINLAAGRGPADAVRKLRGDLDHIVLTAMNKRPRRRYSSVAALSRDVTSYLNEEPLETRIYTRAQRVRQFVRRHKVAVVAILLMILALTGLVLGMAINSRHSNQKVGVSTSLSGELTTS